MNSTENIKAMVLLLSIRNIVDLHFYSYGRVGNSMTWHTVTEVLSSLNNNERTQREGGEGCGGGETECTCLMEKKSNFCLLCQRSVT